MCRRGESLAEVARLGVWPPSSPQHPRQQNLRFYRCRVNPAPVSVCTEELTLESFDWPGLVTKAIRELHGDSVQVKGAKLHAKVAELAAEQGESLAEYLKSSGVKFNVLVQSVPDVVVLISAGTDMSVGLQGARPPIRLGKRRIRPDVFQAFTRVDERPFFYDSALDRFTQDPVSSSAVELPRVTWENLREDRIAFAKSLPDEAVTEELMHPASLASLKGFHSMVMERGLRSSWVDFNVNSVASRIQAWAETEGISIRPEWITEVISRHAGSSPQEVLVALARYLTDEEIRDLAIPFRAVEQMFRELTKHRWK